MPLPIWWAQVPPPDPTVVSISTGLRRAVELQSLSLPDGLIGVRTGLAIWMLAIAVLAALALLAQGPRAFFGQLGDFGGHSRFVGAAGRRLRNAFRLIVALLVVLVLAWTTTQCVEFLSSSSVMGLEPRGLVDVKALLKSGGGSDRAWELGVTEAIGPVRDLGGLGDLVVLLIIAGVAAFQFAADHSGSRGRIDRDGPGAWASVAWGAAGLYTLWRFAAIVGRRDGVPLVGCLPGEMFLIPLLMIFADGLLLAWILAELRDADFSEEDRPFLDSRGALMLFPLGAFVSVLIAPTRVMAHAYWLGKDQLQTVLPDVNLLEFAMIAQGVTLPLLCVLGVVAWVEGPG